MEGVAGIPVVKIGKQLRFPRITLEELIGSPISWPPIDTTSSATPSRPTLIRHGNGHRARPRRTDPATPPTGPERPAMGVEIDF
jgi:hypothetical protein